jgi:hypothetical protein
MLWTGLSRDVPFMAVLLPGEVSHTWPLPGV